MLISVNDSPSTPCTKYRYGSSIVTILNTLVAKYSALRSNYLKLDLN